MTSNNFNGGIMSFYLLEIGSEEIPAGFINTTCDFLKSEFEKRLQDGNIEYGSVQTGGTPRRFYVFVKDIADKQKDSEELIMGPPASVAYDADGNLTKAGLGFAKSKGIDESVLKKLETEKGAYLSGVKKSVGIETVTVLKDMIPEIIKAIPFKKSMKWGDKDFRFARPVHWFVSLFNSEILEFEIDGIKSGNKSLGHRIMSPEEIVVSDFEDYKNSMKAAFVILDASDRKKMVADQLAKISADKNIVIDADEELLDTVANIVEYPHAILGDFEQEYLELPSEVLITSMKNHQKYFYAEDKNGKLINNYVGVSNTIPKDDSVVKAGYGRVLRARLSDAKFFYQNDKNNSLEKRAEELKKVVYQEKLGTSFEKMERFSKIALYFSETLNPAVKETTERTAYLCKADLLTEMVYEFPELQGIMGREYSKLQGEPEVVSKAIYEHYLPRFAGDDLPSTDEGAFVSMADKLDTICGCFSIGLIPSGNNDPYALRRNAIGILNTIREKGYRVNLVEAIDYSLNILGEKLDFNKAAAAEDIFTFFIGRLKQILVSEGIPASSTDAVLSGKTDIIGIEKAAKALYSSAGTEEFKIIAAGYKRINNILKKNAAREQFDAAFFEKEEEKILADVITSSQEKIEKLIAEENFAEAMQELLKFSGPVNSFFDGVMVMAEDEDVKNNRLGLLAVLRNLFDRLGDLSAIV